MTGSVRVERNGSGVAQVTLDRPDVLNAIDDTVCTGLVAAFDALEADGETRVVAVAGAGGRAFSSGADLRHMRGLSGAALSRFIELTWWSFDRVARSPLLTIAALDGYALGGGAELALACDMRIAGPTAAIGFPEMTLGSVPGSGAMQRLPALIGYARSVELVVGGRRIGPGEAAAMGLANWEAGAGGALPEAMEWAAMAAQRPADGLRYAKVALRMDVGDGTAAAALHGLVSAHCQSAAGYRNARESVIGAPRATGEGG